MKKIRYFIAFGLACTILFLSILASTPSYAWIYFHKITPGSDFTVTDGYATEVKYGYYLEQESSGSYTYVWNKWLDCVPTAENEYDIVDQDGNPVAYTGEFRFGKIDNVATTDPDNYVYLQFKFNINSGSTATLNLSYLADPTNGNSRYMFYKGIRTDDGFAYEKMPRSGYASLYTQLEQIEATRGAFMIHSYAFSSNPYAAESTSVGPGELTFKEYNQNALTYIDLETTAGENNIVINLANENITADQDGNVYLYVKIAPNLSAYVESVNYIINYMPCIIDFGVKASLIIQ